MNKNRIHILTAGIIGYCYYISDILLWSCNRITDIRIIEPLDRRPLKTCAAACYKELHTLTCINGLIRRRLYSELLQIQVFGNRII